LTNSAGAPVPSSRSAGPGLPQDPHLTEALARLARERIPERVVHAKGAAAFGSLAITSDLSRYTKAAVLQPGSRTEVLVRFSNFCGETGAADAERDVRGFALKAYTPDGNWDLVGSNLPVSCIRDPAKFPDLVHASKRHPVRHVRSPTAIWDFWSLSPESIHQIVMLFSDRGRPDGFRHMHGYGGHAFGLINGAGERVWAKFHFKTLQGIRNLSDAEAGAVIAQDRESAQRDLFEAIERDDPPRWSFCLQIMTEEQARQLSFDAFDSTRTWPHADFPLIEAGILTLDRNPEHYFAQVEQATFSPSNLVPGIGFSPDRLLHGRLLAYPDAQRYRVGTHHASLPVNRPTCPVHGYHADGAMLFDVPTQTEAYYEPNSFGGPAPDRRAVEPPPLPETGGRVRAKGGGDYRQAAALVQLMSPAQRQSLLSSLATALAGVPDVIQRRQIAHFHLVDPALGTALARLLSLD
jgi:catalase